MDTQSVMTGRRLTAGLMGLLLIALSLGVLAPGAARADTAPADPASATTPVTVSADPLPTVQIDGVAWSQVVVGNTVYVAGKFGFARPAGAAAGTQETVRNNLLAYDIRTGALITSFAPDLNGQALVVTASPDGSRIYVGGDFTSANGQPRYRIAAYSTVTGQLVPDFKPIMGSQVRAIVATGDTVYLGGGFKSVNGEARSRLAAVSASDGSLRSWAPVAGAGKNYDGSTAINFSVMAMVLTDNASKVVVGGRFGTLNGQAASGIGALDAVTGATLPFAVSTLVTNQGDHSAIYSLSTDGAQVYATGYDYSGPGNLEGALAADASTGELVWMADCHGDSYSSAPIGGALYVAGHPHVCSNIGGFPEASPRLSQYALAYSTAPSSATVGTATIRNRNFTGKPAPAIAAWWPTFLSGQVTGQGQAGWSVAGNSEYVVFAGEFPGVNNKAQAGLVRFAVSALAPNEVGPDSSSALTPALASVAKGAVRVSWSTTTDRDNANLVYEVYRSDRPTTPVYRVTAASTYRLAASRLSYVDTGLTPGAEYTYRIRVSDPFGNALTSAAATVTAAATGSSADGAYATTVRADGAVDHWRLGESGGTTGYDLGSAALDLTTGSGVSRGKTGALAGDSDTAYEFSGNSAGLASTRTAIAGPQTFTIETFVRTTTRSGGKLVGFGNASTGTSGSYDRHLYLDRSGYLYFGVYPGAERTVRTPNRINDGQWHQVVATLSSEGMKLYVDGTLVSSRTDTTSAQVYNGFWRLGGDTTWGSNGTWFSGQLDETAIYPTALTAEQVANHYTAARTGTAANIAPAAAFESAATDLELVVDGASSTDADGTVAGWAWDFGDGSTGTGTTASHTYAAAGTYAVTLTVTDDQGATSSVTRQVTVTEPAPNVVPTAEFTVSADALSVAVDGSASADSDGAVQEWAWDFGDGSTGTGVTASHTYAAAGTYEVVLTVTDDDGATATTTQTVGVTTALAVDGFGREVSGGWGQADTGGAWAVSGGAANFAVTGGTGQWTVAPGKSVGARLPVSAQDVVVEVDLALQEAPTGGGSFVSVAARRIGTSDYRAKLWVSSRGTAQLSIVRVLSGAETVLQTVTLPEGYTAGEVLRVRLEAVGSGTTTLRAKAWEVTGTEPADWQLSVTDGTAELQAAGGVYLHSYISGSATTAQVARFDRLYAGAPGTAPAPQPEPEPDNVVPTAEFTVSADALSVAVDGSASADSDGAVQAWAWDFGDGSTGTGVTASHTYAAAGTYEVALTVTDDDGATATTTRSVTVTAPVVPDEPTEPTDPDQPAPLAVDGFGREVSGGWGQADTGGAWAVSGGAANFAVTGGTGQWTVAPGKSVGARLPVSAQDVVVEVDLALQEAPTGGGSFVSVAARRIGTSDYRAKLWVSSRGTAQLSIVRVLSGAETVLQTVTLPEGYTAGEVLRVRLEAVGSGTTTLRAKAWEVTGTEPADWQLSVTDGTAELQAAGGVYLHSYISGSATTAQVARFDQLAVRPVG
ncbi:PKD domain-containing protein [Blastococcus sp. SYSU DS0619]